jgi:hypothetical protein
MEFIAVVQSTARPGPVVPCFICLNVYYYMLTLALNVLFYLLTFEVWMVLITKVDCLGERLTCVGKSSGF